MGGLDPTDLTKIDTFLQTLPEHAHLASRPAAFWNRAGVWHERVVEKRLQDEAIVASLLERHGLLLVCALCRWTGLETNATTTTALSALLAHEMGRRHTAHWAQTLLLIVELLQNRRYDAVASAARMLLPSGAVDAVEHAGFTSRGLRLAYALAVYGQNPDDLALLLLYERAERCSYARYSLALPDGTATAMVRPTPDVLRTALVPGIVNTALNTFEGSTSGGGRSLCLRVLEEPDRGYLVFINRVLREVGIHELDNTAFADEAELIVLKFSPDLERLEEHSTRCIGSQLGEAIVAQLIGRPVVYIDGAVISSRSAVSSMVAQLQHSRVKEMQLVEVHLRQAPIEGSPTLILRSQDSRPLGASLEAFSQHGIDLLADLDNIRSLSLSYQSPEDVLPPHQFKLRLLHTGVGIHVQYSNAQTSRRTRLCFEEYLKQQYDIAATPAAF